MKIIKQIVSCVLFLALGVSAVFNILFLVGKISESLLQTGFLILMSAVFAVSLLGVIFKNIRKEDIAPISIITPVKEIGVLYVGMLIVWAATYFIAIIFK